MNYRAKTIKGVTLIELVIVMTIIAILSVIASKPLIQGFMAYNANKQMIDAQWQARHTIEYMSRELRIIRSPADISSASSNQITFTTSENQTISYTVNAAKQLLRLNAQGLNQNEVLAEGVANLSFTYYDHSGAVTTTPSAIRYIKINVHIIKGTSDFTVTTSVAPRNLA